MINIKTMEANMHVDTLYALIQSSEKKFTTDGKLYLDLILQDISGIISAKFWDANEEDALMFCNGKIVKLSGDTTVYRKELQFKIKTIELYDGIDIGHFLPSAPISKDKLKDEIEKYVFQIKNHKINVIVSKLLEKFESSFYEYPAASKNHHEYVSGLAHHVLSMLELAEFVCANYEIVNKDLLYAGVILHDIGKVIELNGNVSTEYTLEGKLLGHISIGINEVALMAKEHNIEGEEVLLIQHLIISHHGKMEFGSPKEPAIVEAEVLNLLDNLDARLNMFTKVLSDTAKNDFTPRVFALESRKFYNHGLDKDE